MAFNREQAASPVSGGNSFSVQLPATPTAGNALFVLAGWVSSGSANQDMSIADDQGTMTWHSAVTSPNEFGARTKIFYAFDIPAQAANPTVTVTRVGSTGMTSRGHIEEWSGFGTNDPLSATTSRAAGNTSSANTNTSGVTGELDAVVFAVVQQSTVSATITVETVTPAWTQIWDTVIPGSNRGEADYKIVTAAGTQICRWTFGSNSNYSASLAAFVSGQVATTGERINQASRSVVSTLTSTTLRVNQTIRSTISQADPVIRLNQVVLTLVVLPDTTPAESALSSRRGIYVPTRGIAGSEGGGGQTPFTALTGRLIVVPTQKRVIYMPVTELAEGNRAITVTHSDRHTAIYVSPAAEGDITNGVRTVVVPKGAEGYTHR